MATFWEPPALLTLAVVLGGGGAVLYYALRPALRGPLPMVTSERDEVWGVEDPPPPPKKRYIYPADRPVEQVVVPLGPDREPEPLAVMPASPTIAPLRSLEARPGMRADRRLDQSDAEDPVEPDEPGDEDDEDDEPSLADLFRSRRPRARTNDATPQD